MFPKDCGSQDGGRVPGLCMVLACWSPFLKAKVLGQNQALSGHSQAVALQPPTHVLYDSHYVLKNHECTLKSQDVAH